MDPDERQLGRSLRQWRDRVGPAAVGLPVNGTRRITGLRREELAQLAGISVDYVTRLEQGRASSPSAQVLTALARALRLSRDERDYLFEVAGHRVPGEGRIQAYLTPGVQRLLDRLDDTPVAVYDAAWNLLAWNPTWAALMGDCSGLQGRERNLPWRYFNGGRGRVAHTPEQLAEFELEMVADLRAATARYPLDPDLRRLIDDLKAAHPRFAQLWAGGTVAVHTAAHKLIEHPEVGSLVLDCDVLSVQGSDLRIVAYTAEPASESADKLALLRVLGLQPFTP